MSAKIISFPTPGNPESSNSFSMPGEPLTRGKPWLRRLGDSVIRYVRESLERQDPTMRLARDIDGSGHDRISQALLRRRGQLLQKELDALTDARVSVPHSQMHIQKAPVFDRHGQVIDVRLGLVLESEFVAGERADTYQALFSDERNDIDMQREYTYAGLKRYLEEKRLREEPFLCDVFTPDQYMVGVTASEPYPELRLVDIDPFFAVANKSNFERAHALIEMHKNEWLGTQDS